jgi:DNA-binding response OmpR family regulator
MDPMRTPSPLRILLVEDDEHDRIVFRRAFQNSEVACEIMECEQAEEALERLRADASSFDLVVIDHALPGMSGLELCKRLLREEIPLPLVMLTGRGSVQIAIEALKAGIDDYIIKDPGQGYLDLLPVALLKVVQKHDDRLTRKQADESLRKKS